jgi:hypothetical protein
VTASPAGDRESPRVRPIFYLVLVVFAAGVSLGSAELLLRARGYGPWRPRVAPGNRPELGEPDPVLGWRNKPGRYVFAGYADPADQVTVTIESDSRRSSGPQPAAPRARVTFVGDSITMGWAISDPETFAWKLQQRFPDVAFANYGTGGYSTYQSLLVMRGLLAAGAGADLILYGFYDDHLKRNVAEYSTVEPRILRAHFDPWTAPFCLTDARGRLVEYPPEPMVLWPLRDSLASVYLLEQSYVRARGARRAEHTWGVAEQVALEMDRTAREHGARFAFVFLNSKPYPQMRYTKFLSAHSIPAIDCNRPFRLKWIVVNEGHPNGLMNTEWADCLAEALPALLPEAAQH